MDSRSYISKDLVAPGTYVISGTSGGILEVYLGSCVGVTLCDRDAKVGGLIHFLLPEPTDIDKPWQPESYASTGMPLFIQALCGKGACKERLEACVAGGALVGPLSERDLLFDIGGRTVEIVENILNKEGIPVLKAESGGYFTCVLSLNLRTLKSHIEPLGLPDTTYAVEDFKKPTSEQVDMAVARVRPIPQLALKIIRMIPDDSYNMQDIARDIRQDQIISAKVISLCNSAFFSVKMKIESIDRALVTMGEKRLLQLVVSALLETFFPQSQQGYSLCKGGLFYHAVGTAVTSEKLADFTGKVSTGTAYTSGLLHDIGKVVLDQYIANTYPLFYRRTQVDGDSLVDVEREEFGVAHTEVGGRLAELWSLPEILTDTIRNHHHPEQATVDSELTHIVYLADLLMSRFSVGQELERITTDNLRSRLKKVGLKPDQFSSIIDSIPPQILNGSLLAALYS